MALFEPHGDTSVYVRGRVIRLLPHASGNEEEVQRLFRQLRSIVSTFDGKPWAMMVILTGADLLTPEAEEQARRFLPQMLSAGHRAMAIVVLDRSARWMIEAQFRRIFAQTPIALDVFESVAEADAWVDAALGDS